MGSNPQKDIFDTEPKRKTKRPSLLTRKPESLAKPKNDPEELRRARRAAKKLLKEEQGAVICILVGAGIPDRTIARILKMDIRSLRKNFPAELEDGAILFERERQALRDCAPARQQQYAAVRDLARRSQNQ